MVYRYGLGGRLAEMTFPAGALEGIRYLYDRRSQLVGKQGLVSGELTQYAYDELGRLIKVTYPDNSTVTYKYDPLGNRLQPDFPGVQTLYTYDRRGRLTSQSQTIYGASEGEHKTLTTGFAYEPVGNLTGLTYPDGETVTYTYDPFDRLTAIAGYIPAITYDLAGAVEGIAYANGKGYNVTGRDGRNRPTALSLMGTPLTYQYDGEGNVLALQL